MIRVDDADAARAAARPDPRHRRRAAARRGVRARRRGRGRRAAARRRRSRCSRCSTSPTRSSGPYFEETIYVTPSRLPADDARRASSDVTARAARRDRARRRARCTRSCASTATACRRDRGRGPVDRRAVRAHAALRCRHRARGGDPAPRARACRSTGSTASRRASGVMMLPIPRAGRAARGRRAGRGARGRRASSGSRSPSPAAGAVVPLPEGDRYLGFLFARGDTPDGGRGRAARRRTPRSISSSA